MNMARRKNVWERFWTVPVLAALLVGCSSSGMSDLQQFVAEAKAKKGQVEPLPEFKPAETFVYSAGDLKDPFETWKSEVKPTEEVNKVVAGIRPDVRRRREVLENYPLDTLRMIGSVEFKSQRWGLVKAPDGIIYRVRPDNYLGQNYGRIVEVTENKLILTEIVPDGLGGWQERQATLSVGEDE